MIGALNPTDKKVTVIGAGIAGLLAAYQLNRAGWEVTLLEASQRTGGLIDTYFSPFGLSEKAAHSFIATQKVLNLCDDLKVKLLPMKATGQKKYILKNACLKRVPLSFREILFTLFKLLNSPTPSTTLDVWAKAHLGVPALNYLINPFIHGIYGAEPKDISVEAAYPRLIGARGYSFFKLFPPAKIMAPALGMSALTHALEDSLFKSLGNRFQKGVFVQQLPSAPNVVLCTPAYAAAQILSLHDSYLSQALQNISYTSLTSTTFFVSKTIRRPFGTGVLVPSEENRKILGILFNSDAWSGRVHLDYEDQIESFSAIARNSLNTESFSNLEEVQSELKSILGLRSSPLHRESHRSPKAIPQYDAFILRAWDCAKRGWCSKPGRILFGNYTGEVSLRGMIETSFIFSKPYSF
jgi:protoporphyrinogen/coproporphyrinogen III oxidase